MADGTWPASPSSHAKPLIGAFRDMHGQRAGRRIHPKRGSSGSQYSRISVSNHFTGLHHKWRTDLPTGTAAVTSETEPSDSIRSPKA